MDEFDQFKAIINALCAGFGTESDEAVIEAYHMGLDDVPLGALRVAVKRAMREGGKFMPRPAELRAMAGDQSPKDEAARAWGKVVEAIGSVGHRRSVNFDATTNAAVRRTGGWGNLCRTQTDAMPFRRNDFIAAWLDLRTRDPGGDGRALIGSCTTDSQQIKQIDMGTTATPRLLGEGGSG